MSEQIVKEKIDFITKTLKVLRDILEKRKNSPYAEYLLFAAEKKAEEVIEAAVSLNQEILKSHFDHLSGSYYESFTDLKKTALFSDEELRALASTAGFRNRLAHDYIELNPDITLKSIEKLLQIYPDYLKKLKKFLKQ